MARGLKWEQKPGKIFSKIVFRGFVWFWRFQTISCPKISVFLVKSLKKSENCAKMSVNMGDYTLGRFLPIKFYKDYYKREGGVTEP